MKCIKEVFPVATKTAFWIIKITVGISLAILFLKYFKVLPWFSELISPLFNHIGLPGEAALAYVSGYFVNVYTAISVAVSLDLDVRAMTILGVMVLCSHNMITETAVQKKSGSSAIRIVVIRTFSAFFLALLTFGMETTLFRFGSRKDEDGRLVYSTALRMVGTVAALFVALVLVFSKPVATALGYAGHPE